MNTINTTTKAAPVRSLYQLSLADKTNLILQVWGNLAPENKFAGMTRGEFQVDTAATRDIRDEISVMKTTRKGAIATRNAADKTTAALLVAVAAGVKADPYHGINSSLYRAMGFVPASERKPRSGSSVSTAPAAGAASSGTGTASPSPAKVRHDLVERVKRFQDAWGQFAPDASFGGHTLAAFTTAVAPSQTLRDQMAKDSANLAGTIASKNSADRATTKLIQRVVSAIKADVEFGTDSAFYRALGYVTDTERRSPKRTVSAAQTAAAKATA